MAVDHERGGSVVPTFVDVGTPCFLAHRRKLEPAHDRWERQHGHPPEPEVHEAGQHVQVHAVQLRANPESGAGPHDGQHRQAGRSVKHEQAKRRVRASDQDEDRRVVEPAHPSGRRLAPLPHVVRGAHTELGHQGEREHQGRGAGAQRRGQEHEDDPGRYRGEERRLVDPPAHEGFRRRARGGRRPRPGRSVRTPHPRRVAARWSS